MKRRDGVPDVVYAESREHAQKLLDESYLAKFKAVPHSEWDASCAANAAQERLRVVEAGLVAAREALQRVVDQFDSEEGLWTSEQIAAVVASAREALAALVPDTERTEQ